MDREMTNEEIYGAFGLEMPEASETGFPGFPGKSEGVSAAEDTGETVSGEISGDDETAEEETAEEETKRSPDSGQPMSPEERHANAERRRERERRDSEEERRKAIEDAVSAAVTAEREKVSAEKEREYDQRISTLLRKARLRSSVDGSEITDLRGFEAWANGISGDTRDGISETRSEFPRSDGAITQAQIDAAIARSPELARLKAAADAEEAKAKAAADAEFKKKVDAEIAQIHAIDPSINSTADLTRMPDAEKFSRYVREGKLSFIDAFYLCRRDRISAEVAAKAAASARINDEGKEHLSAVGASRGGGNTYVPRDVAEMYRVFNPEMSDSEILKRYNAEHKQKK